MMRLLTIFLFIVTTLVSANARNPRSSLLKVGELPDRKTPDLLRPKERNPFAGKEAKNIATVTEDRVSEESILRLLLSQMSVTGVIRSEGSNKALLDRIVLQEGQPLPKIMAGQTETLRVGKIAEDQAEIFFVENDERVEPRKIVIPIKLKPAVTQRWFATGSDLPQNPPKPKP